LPKIVQKNLIYIALSILILTTTIMIMPRVFKNNSPENTPTKSQTLTESRDLKTTGSSSDSIPAVGRIPEPQPQNVSALPTATTTAANHTEQSGIQALPADSKTSVDSQAGSSKHNPDIKVDNPSLAVDQPVKTENEQKGTPVNDSLNKTDSSNGVVNGKLESLSDTSGETEKTEKRQVPLKKEPSKDRSRCGSLYKKISLGQVLSGAETEFLTHHCK
jgi:hypothetical protein